MMLHSPPAHLSYGKNAIGSPGSVHAAAGGAGTLKSTPKVAVEQLQNSPRNAGEVKLGYGVLT